MKDTCLLITLLSYSRIFFQIKLVKWINLGLCRKRTQFSKFCIVNFIFFSFRFTTLISKVLTIFSEWIPIQSLIYLFFNATNIPKHMLIISQIILTCKRVNADGGTHFLKLDPKLWVLADLLFMFAGKFFQVGLERFQLLRHLAKKGKKCSLVKLGLQLGLIFIIYWYW